MVEENSFEIRSDEEITENSDHWQTYQMMSAVLRQLLICKEKVDDIMNDSGWDAAYFDVEISLKVKFGGVVVEVGEGWEALEP